VDGYPAAGNWMFAAADWNNESAAACFFSSLCAYAGEVKSGGLGDVGCE